ncbi:MAG: protein-(glutamine-N5) methyltransferase, release factor-specific [Sulfurimonas sp. RIFCSPHIGHO2_12_FULL_36_9]|uniref:peptide chain release factor N(5)-glutamine methyltransferase n=1 Tax=Sulfurimonas sp. RIFCSPLOWO2_12_36_12 TaxID=1802253 RepID=UPI0008BB461C|nr:peptide chain release factor N(5)-glutamine methyltransferase [Sulfurimonas sp. RIFCSPLOWO2_12_36_12]OHD98396.1 MAG: protein-(glutamine-N5) methyltransferase, release factor-specific [Sulfurimonas sp. RIFCSPHIGHO2_12_FULL_36_9]OHE00395.1 MAG: protein-(glutamine-N5) methyltransferase, release factor-specific [Sulfurimonas sp. RIFCSPLOWO2_02_FULL_36_28]OHE01481.1 MAG: protein-(glutamine-N5) methyltransferase, release factor-specific [Sulfurimonas sp. RIFCSPLOWO2_12_36_12]OHE08101.1 MAG: protei
MSSRYLVKDILKEITAALNPHIERAPREAQLLLMHHLGVDELWLLTNQNAAVKDVDKLLKWVERRAKNEPLEYITQRVSFYSEEFFIAQGALIPRPETELLIDEVIKNIKNRDSNMTFAEVGVGSGIISIMLAKHFTNAKFIAVDISQDAIEIAKKNIEKFGLENRIELRLGSLLEPIGEDIDYLVSNPPYIANDFKLESNLSYEPQNALFGGTVGDEIIRELLDEVLNRKINFFSCEIGYDQQDKIRNYLNNKPLKKLEFYKDFSDFDRGFTLGL